MSTARGNFAVAIANVRANKGRSLLTMLGVVIGIVAVVTVVGLGEGVKQQIAQQTNQYGSDLITVRPGHTQAVSGIKALANTDLLFGLNSLSGFSTQDVSAVQHAPGVKLAAPLGVISGSVQATSGPANTTLPNALVLATNADLPGALHQRIASGGFFGSSDAVANVAVLGKHVAEALFEQDAPLGNTFSFRGQTFLVGGVFDDFAAAPLSGTANFNDAIFIPVGTAEQLSHNETQFYSILAKPAQADGTKAAIMAITNGLQGERGGAQDFSVLDQQQNLAASSNVLDLLSGLVGAVAIISLLVGGVGIMNIMLVSVTERMHEIGVRKAIGATNRQILAQFTLEALVLGAAGGVLGVIASAIVAVILRVYTTYHPVIAWRAMITATLVSLVVGVVFGVIPAIKAARKDPVDALRHE